MVGFLALFIKEMLECNKPVKEEVIKNASIAIKEVITVPEDTMINPYTLMPGDFSSVFMPGYKLIKFEYKGKEYATKEHKFLLKYFDKIEDAEGRTIKQNILVKTYKHGYTYVHIVD